jgi:hypothetical protein
MEEKKIQIKTNSCDIGTEEVLISREENIKDKLLEVIDLLEDTEMIEKVLPLFELIIEIKKKLPKIKFSKMQIIKMLINGEIEYYKNLQKEFDKKNKKAIFNLDESACYFISSELLVNLACNKI